MSEIGIGVIGVGTFGEIHARIFHEHPQVRLVAVADVNEAQAKKVAAAYHARAYTAYEDLLGNPDIQAVSIVVPDMLHKEPCVKAAAAGKHILLEKPLATSVEDGQAILTAAEKNRVKLMVDFMNRWSPPFSLAKKAIDEGELGEVLYVNMKLNDTLFVPTRMLSWAGKSSVLWFLGSHAIDLIVWLLGERVDSVSCVSRSRVLEGLGIHTPDFFHSVLEFKGGAVARIENSWVLPEQGPTVFEFSAEIVGTKGKIDIDTARNGCIIKTSPGGYRYPDPFCLVEVDGRMRGFGHTALDHFVQCLVEDRQPAVDRQSSLYVTKIITRLMQSAAGRQIVKVE